MALAESPRVAVLALQGDFEKHIEALRRLGADAVAARLPADIEGSDGLILPGGESTAIGKLMTRYGLDQAIKDAHNMGKPIYGTCAGLILLGKEIEESTQERGGQTTLGILDVSVARNAYGRQIESFEHDISVPLLGKPDFRAVFIRAPKITRCGETVEVLAEYGGSPILIVQGNVFGSSFHPELSGDDRIHNLFLTAINKEKSRVD
jgi:5'-phosphate synthase pdxT subunit